MMSEIEAGFYKGVIVATAVDVAKSGLPKFNIKFKGTHEYVLETDSFESIDMFDITGFFTLIQNNGEPMFHAKDIMRVLGWSGQSFSELDAMELADTEVTFRVEENEYNDKITMQVRSIDKPDATPMGLQRLDASEVKGLDTQYKNVLAGLGGKKAPEKKTRKPKPAAEPKPKESPKDKTPPKRLAVQEPIDDEPAKTMTMDEAWEAAEKLGVTMKADAERVEKDWLQAVDNVAKGVDDADVTPEQWAKIYDQFAELAECPF